MTKAYHANVPDAEAFSQQRAVWRREMGEDQTLRERAVDLMRHADKYRLGYQWEWCGVPIIRFPDDMVMLQEIVWQVQPACIVETGVARGGSLVLSASLMAGAGLCPRVLGIDNRIHDHTVRGIENTPFSGAISLWEGNSSSEAAAATVERFLRRQDIGPAVLVLDSDHTHDHVLAELRNLAPLFGSGSVIAVADTIIEEMPVGYYPARAWGKADNPATAIREFLRGNADFSMDTRWSRRGLVSEFRDGILVRL